MIDYIFFTGLFICLLAGQFTRIELFHQLVNGYVQEVILVIFSLYSLKRFGTKPISSFLRQKGVLVMTSVFLISFIISFPSFSLSQNAVAFLYFLRLCLYTVFGIYLFFLVKKKKPLRKMLNNLLYTFSVLLLVTTAIQYVFFPNFWSLYNLGWDPHLYRASATFLDVYVAAAIYGIFAFYWFQKNKRLLSLLFVLALVFTFSRSAYVAFLCSLGYFFLSQKRWKELLIMLCIFFTFLLFVPKPFGEGVNLLRTASINSRIKDYSLAITVWEHKPIFGYGYNRIRFAKEQLNLIGIDDHSHSASAFHSSFLIILVTTGIAGLVSFFILIIYCMKKYPVLRVYFIYLGIMSLFDNVFLHVLIILPLLCILSSLSQLSLE